MLSDFKKFVKNNESNIILSITIVLIALISFGTGLLINSSGGEGEVIIQNPSALVIKAIESSSAKATADKQGTFVGSVNSNKYHWPDCSFAKRIAQENQIWFSSEQEAQNAGYVRCSSFEKYIPTKN